MMTLAFWTDIIRGARAFIIIVINRHNPLYLYMSNGCAVYDDNDENTVLRAGARTLFFIYFALFFFIFLQIFSVFKENDNNNHKKEKDVIKQLLSGYYEKMTINDVYDDLKEVAV